MNVDFGLISIITPVFNCERYAASMIESVLSQSYQNWELLITDDCSDDDTARIIDNYVSADSRIHYFKNDINLGVGPARNVSLEHAKGRFVAFLDGDDRWMPEKLQTQLEYIEKHGCAICGTSYYIIDENDEVKGIVRAPARHTFFHNLCDNKIGLSTCIIDRRKVTLAKSPTMRKSQDWGHMMLLLRQCRIAYQIKEPLSYYRKRQGSLSSDKLDLVRFHIKMYHDVLGWSMVSSSLCFIFCYMPVHLIKMCKVKFDSFLYLV